MAYMRPCLIKKNYRGKKFKSLNRKSYQWQAVDAAVGRSGEHCGGSAVSQGLCLSSTDIFGVIEEESYCYGNEDRRVVLNT